MLDAMTVKEDNENNYKEVEKYDLHKVPDDVIIKEMRKTISGLEVEIGKLNAYILEIEDKMSKQRKSFNIKYLYMIKKLAKELQASQELNSKVSKEERKEIKKELVYNEILSALKKENEKLKKQAKNSKTSNNHLFSIIVQLKKELEEKQLSNS
jgi:hypothetical protein